jgi:phenylalanyl-tRNA synthetase beta chain
MDALMPIHVIAQSISKFQGVSKDLSVVIDKDLGYHVVAKALSQIDNPYLKKHYPVDVYRDEKLGKKKSLTIRCFIQSNEKTLSDEDIESVMRDVMKRLSDECQAELRS